MELDSLKELGLSDGQVAVYTSVLELGISTLNKIQEKTGIERRNIYDILNKLIEKGLIAYTITNGKRTYQCTHPNKIREEIKKKKEALKKLDGQIPQIKGLFDLSRPDIGAEIYRGNEAIKAFMNESLEYKEIYFIGGNSGIEQTSLKFWFKDWMRRRAEKKVMMYDLVDYGTYLEGLHPQHMVKHKKEYYQYCELPKDLQSPMVIQVFGDKVAQILWHEQPFAFVLESKEIRESFMRYFDYFWKKPKD
jgi:sugar-specific transcriptional regulator TrmB